MELSTYCGHVGYHVQVERNGRLIKDGQTKGRGEVCLRHNERWNDRERDERERERKGEWNERVEEVTDSQIKRQLEMNKTQACYRERGKSSVTGKWETMRKTIIVIAF